MTVGDETTEAVATASAPQKSPTPHGGVAGRTLRGLGRPGVPTRMVLAAALLVVGLWAAYGGPYLNLIGQLCAVFAIAAVGQSVLIGGAGQIAFAGAAFMAIGAFTTGLLAETALGAFPVTLVVCALVGWVVGLVSGLPGLRFRGLYLLLSTMALHFIVFSIVRNYQIDAHPAGLVVPALQLGSLDLSLGQPLYLTILSVLGLVCVIIWLVERTGVGLAWRALKESEAAAAVSGVDVVRWKLYAYAISGAVTAVAGSLFAYVVGRADYESYDLHLAISIITMVFIGGVRSRFGAVIGAIVITALPYVLQTTLPGWLASVGLDAELYTSNQSMFHAGLFSLLFLLTILFEPNGIEGLVNRAESAIRQRVVRGGSRSDWQEPET